MMKFRTATLADSEDIVKLVNSAYRGDYSKQGWTTEADLLGGQRTDVESIAEIIQTPNNSIEIAVNEQGQILASVHLKQEQPDTLYFGMLTVEPTQQGSGVGKQLMSHVEKKAKEFGLAKIRITVIHLRDQLIAYYERRGFRPTGHDEPFPENDPKFGIPKVPGMRLKEFSKDL